MPLDERELQHLARLARLQPSDEARVRLVSELEGILAHVAELSQVDTDGVEPWSAPPTHAALRADEVAPGLTREEALAEAPRTVAGAFAVPGFVDGQ